MSYDTGVVASTAPLAKKEYAVYSSSNIRPYLYAAYPTFNEDRIPHGIILEDRAVFETQKFLFEWTWSALEA